MEEQKSIEVTEAMLDAGFMVLAVSGIADEYSGADRLLLADIFRAMYLQLSSSPHSDGSGQTDPS